MADIFSEPKVDTHCHILDPLRFPYAADVAYRPQGQEIGDQQALESVMASHGVRHALLVGPNSGYNLDNRCMLHAIATGGGRFKGIAVVPSGVDNDTLMALQSQGVVGVAMNIALNGLDYYAAGLPALLRQLETLGLWAQFQVEADQLVELLPHLENTACRLLFDHCGRPVAARGTAQRGFQALLALGREGRAVVKLSGEVKFSGQRFPFADARPYWDALLQAFGTRQCLWASDWPYLKAPFRLDYGPMLQRWESYLSPAERQEVLWDNPCRLFGFGEAVTPAQ
ncbi:MAG: amidohydrolase family protein [Rhodoferax sp.]|nr:amidohydrolase family protein [Rhodoferax sp.]